MEHVRDYAQTLTEGGTKGEKCDYLLVKVGDSLRYVPVLSKLKLNKKRKAQAAGDEDERAPGQVEHIVLAPRGLAAEDARQMQANLSLASNQAVRPAMTHWETKQQLTDLERAVASEVKSLFVVAIGKNEDAQMHEEEEDDIFASKPS